MNTQRKIWVPVFETNDIDALIPEVWAQEALIYLEQEAMAAGMVFREFEDEIAEFGDTVNAHRPGTFEMKRKGFTDDVVDQDAIATKVPVVMNQHLYTSFIIRDGQESYAMKKLRTLFMEPALQSIVQGIDRMVFGQVYQFMGNSVSKLDAQATKSTAIALDRKMSELNIPAGFRNCVLTAKTKADLLEESQFTDANKRGDGGEAMRRAEIGDVYGTNYYFSNNVPAIGTGNSVVTGAVNNAAGYAAGTTTLTVDGFTGEIELGGWCTIAGDMTPQKIVEQSASASDTDEIVIAPGLNYAVINDAVITTYTPGLIDNTGGYAADWVKEITVDTFSVAPKPNQLISFDTDHADAIVAPTTQVYSAIGTPTTTSLGLLDIPLAAARADDNIVGIGPAGNYNFAFHPHALALVTRPLAAPAPGAGALSAVANFNDLSIRVVITYDGKAQGHRVTVDMLAGIKVLNENLGAVVYA